MLGGNLALTVSCRELTDTNPGWHCVSSRPPRNTTNYRRDWTVQVETGYQNLIRVENDRRFVVILFEKAFYYVENNGHVKDIGYECCVEPWTAIDTPRRIDWRHGKACQEQPIIWKTSPREYCMDSVSLMGSFPRDATTFLPFGSEYFNVVVVQQDA